MWSHIVESVTIKAEYIIKLYRKSDVAFSDK